MTEIEEVGDQPAAQNIGQEESPWSEAQLKYSFETLMNLTFFNFLVFPVGALLWKTRYGFANDFDLSLWVVGIFWQGSLWGIFLLIFLLVPSAIILAWVPWLMTMLIIWPLSYVAYIYQDEYADTTVQSSRYKASSEQSIVLIFISEMELITGYLIIKHSGRAGRFAREHFLKNLDVEDLNDPGQQIRDNVAWKLPFQI